MDDSLIVENLRDRHRYHLLTIPGKSNAVVIGAPHHAPLGVRSLPCKEHPDADENTGFITYTVARLLGCRGIIACNSTTDPNKDKDSEYCRKIRSWKPKFLVEIHGHSGKTAVFDIEISSGSLTRNHWSTALAERLQKKFAAEELLEGYELSGDFGEIYFKASQSFTITTTDWIAFHIELPRSIRKSKGRYSLFSRILSECLLEMYESHEVL